MIGSIHQKLFKKYGTEPPTEILERARTELAFFIRKNYLEELGELDAFISACKSEHEPFVGVGLCSASLVLHLLGITHCNPLPPHYYCPECKTVAWADAEDGYDLPPKNCACGYPLVRDGHGIPPEQLTAKKHPKNPFSFHISPKMYDRLPHFFKDFREEAFADGKIGIGNRLCVFFVNTYVYFQNQAYDSYDEPKPEKIRDCFQSHLANVLEAAASSDFSFSRLLLAYGRARGRRQEPLEEISILFREDLLQLLLSRGADPTLAAYAASYAAAGKGLLDGVRALLTDAERLQLQEGRAMPSKALAIEWQCYLARIADKGKSAAQTP